MHLCLVCLCVCLYVCLYGHASPQRGRESVLVCVCIYNTRVPIAVVEFAVGEDVHALPMELIVSELPCTWLMHFFFAGAVVLALDVSAGRQERHVENLI